MKSNFKNTKLNTNRGITLVALIITIIILLILAMVSIRLVMNGGIIDKANKATQAYKESEIQEQIKLAYNEWQTARWDGTAGYTVSSEPTEQSIDNGLVVKKGDNEWVWIPVSSSDLAAMYTEDATGWTMCGTDVVTKYKSNSRTDVKSNLTRGNPGTTSWREPDVLNNTSYDNKKKQIGQQQDLAVIRKWQQN